MTIKEIVDVKNPNVLSLGGKYEGSVITRMILVQNKVQLFTEAGFHEYPISDGMAIKFSDGTFAQIQYKPDA